VEGPNNEKGATHIAEAVAVVCPMCGEPQPNRSDGSEQWTRQDFEYLAGNFRGPQECVSCGQPLLIGYERKVMFE
jgi:predicted RNA-binding Zn-ribbon protein involved in translation (DUF1610 family)